MDAFFLYMEDVANIPAVLGAVMVLDGPSLRYDQMLEHVQERLPRLPRLRQRLAGVPLGQGQPVWVDDPQFNLRYHVRHVALPAGGGEAQLTSLVAQLSAQRLDRARPLWELWLVDGLGNERSALILRVHHALTDAVAAVPIIETLCDDRRERPGDVPPAGARALPRSAAELVFDALLQRGASVRNVLAFAARSPAELGRAARGVGELAFAVAARAPESPLNVRIGSMRRVAFADAGLDECKRAGAALGGTVNDVVLAAVASALGRVLRRRSIDTEGVVLKALVPVAMRAAADPSAPGNRLAAVVAPLPIDSDDPLEQFATVHAAMHELKRSGQSLGGDLLATLGGVASPRALRQTARLLFRHRAFNLVVSNARGPDTRLYLRGREIRALYPVLPLLPKHALSVAVASYRGRLGFGLLGDFDAMADLDLFAEALNESLAALVAAGRSN